MRSDFLQFCGSGVSMPASAVLDFVAVQMMQERLDGDVSWAVVFVKSLPTSVEYSLRLVE